MGLPLAAWSWLAIGALLGCVGLVGVLLFERARTRCGRRAVARLERTLGRERALFRYAHHDLANQLLVIQWQMSDLWPSADSPAAASLMPPLQQLADLVAEFGGLYGAKQIEQEWWPLTAMVDDVVDAYRPSAQARNLMLVCDIGPTRRCSVHRKKIERILRNLLCHAIKVTPPGGRLDVRLVDTAQGVDLHVLDEGPGMANVQFRERVEQAIRPGTCGEQGLLIIREYVDALGGTLRCDVRRSGGTDVVVSLPDAVWLAPSAP